MSKKKRAKEPEEAPVTDCWPKPGEYVSGEDFSDMEEEMKEVDAVFEARERELLPGNSLSGAKEPGVSPQMSTRRVEFPP